MHHPSRSRTWCAALALALTASAAVPATPAGAVPPDHVPDPDRDAAIVQRLVHEIDLPVFVDIVEDRMGGDDWFDWTTDWCSAPLVGSTGRSFDFRWPCRRHDFAYRNTKLLDVRYGCPHREPGAVCESRAWRHGRWWNHRSRLEIDRRLRTDMRRSCWQQRPWHWASCLMWAETFYRAVRAAGGP